MGILSKTQPGYNEQRPDHGGEKGSDKFTKRRLGGEIIPVKNVFTDSGWICEEIKISDVWSCDVWSTPGCGRSVGFESRHPATLLQIHLSK